MKLVIAIIQPYRLEEVKKALYAVDVNLITVSEVLGHGRQIGVDEFYRGVKETGNGHREAGTTVYDIFSEWKSVYIDYSGRLQKAQIDNIE